MAAEDEHAAPRPRRAPTIYDIAERAGVNPSTVSRALSRPGRINPRTAQKVFDAARELDYVANPAARSLPTGRTGTLGLMVADITNPMFFDIVRGAERETAERGYTLVLAEFRESADTELVTARRLLASVDGLILATSRLHPDVIRELTRIKPVVVVNRRVDDVRSVVPDVARGIHDAVTHLAQLGHTQLVYVSGPDRSWMSRHRWEVVRAAAAAAGVTVSRVPSAAPDRAAGRAVAGDVLATGATGVLAFNDLLAIGLLQELGERGIAVPGAVSIIGFDDVFGADLTTPPLTTIRVPSDGSGSSAAREVFALLDGESAREPESLAATLVVRGSTGPAAQSR